MQFFRTGKRPFAVTSRRALTVVLGVTVGTAGLLVAPAEAGNQRITLRPVASQSVGDSVTLGGRLKNVGARNNKTVVLQQKRASGWVSTDRRKRQDNGRYRFPSFTVDAPGTTKYRTVLRRAGRTLDVSPVRAVVVVPAPTAGTDMLPDLVVKRLNDCSPAEKAKSADGTTCFWIDNTGGAKLLRFPATTYNVGTGPMEIIARRTSGSSDSWNAVQRITTSNGVKRDVGLSADFYWATDGHQHWHIRDFDTYELLDESGTTVEMGEKHGFCLQDNVSYRNWLVDRAAHPGMPAAEVYTFQASCGYQDENTTRITHGLSVGWGDTYPTTLGDQAIDVTGVPDGVYTVKVTADGPGIVRESNTGNNSATASVRLQGNTATWLSDGLGA
jgi:hypothetical protein